MKPRVRVRVLQRAGWVPLRRKKGPECWRWEVAQPRPQSQAGCEEGMRGGAGPFLLPSGVWGLALPCPALSGTIQVQDSGLSTDTWGFLGRHGPSDSLTDIWFWPGVLWPRNKGNSYSAGPASAASHSHPGSPRGLRKPGLQAWDPSLGPCRGGRVLDSLRHIVVPA